MNVNTELHKIGEWFKTNRLSLNTKKTKYTFFHQNLVKDNIPRKLPELKIASRAIERTNAINFLDVLLNDHICSVEKRLAKNIGLLYRAKYLLDESSLKTVYFFNIHLYLSYANIAWARLTKQN